MRPRASPSAPCQTPWSLLHKSCIYPAHNSPFLNLLSSPSSLLEEEVVIWEAVFFSQMFKDVGPTSSARKMICPAPSVQVAEACPRSPLSNAHRWACPLRRKWLTIKVLSSNTEEWRGKDRCRVPLGEHPLTNWSGFYLACHHNELATVLNHRGDTGYKYIIDFKSTSGRAVTMQHCGPRYIKPGRPS